MLTTSALRTNPGNAKIHFSMGNELAQKGNRSCEEFYKEALRLKPDYTLALVNLGLVYLNTGRPKEAEQSYKKALSIKPDHINANTNMGHFYRLQKRWKEALTHYKQALRRRPDSPIFHYYIAWMYGELNEVEEAERELTTCLLLQPNYGDAHLLYGKLLASNERRSALTSVKSSKAIYHYKRGILLTSSNNVNDYIGLGKLLANQASYYYNVYMQPLSLCVMCIV
jgi:tetratricopeptide (TPR) repeat protein